MHNPEIGVAKDVRAGKVALTFFFNLMKKWECTPEQQMTLLGISSVTTFNDYQNNPDRAIKVEQLERISYLISIHISLRNFFNTTDNHAYQWINKPNFAAPFDGKSALEYMLQGRVVDITDVRNYLWTNCS